MPIESFVTTLIHWTFFSDDANKVGICWLCRSGQLHVTPSPRWSLPRCHRSVRNDMRLFLRTNSTQYNSVLQSSEKCYPSTTPYYKVLLQKVLLQYYKVLIQYYSVLQSTTPLLLRTTKYYFVLQSTSPVLLQYYCVLQRTTPVLQSTSPVLLRTTKY